MGIQPKCGIRDGSGSLHGVEGDRGALLNREFFHDVELTEEENRVLVWLCGWDLQTVNAVVSAFRKVV